MIMSNNQFYTSGIRTLMLIHRKKDGGPSKEKRSPNIFEISRNEDDFVKKFNELMEVKEKSKIPYRLYSSVNERDFSKALRLFKMQQIEIDDAPIEQKMDFYFQSRSQFFSCISKPQCAKTNLFLIDIDDNFDEVNRVHLMLLDIAKIISTRQTKNGYHLITEPFNPALAPDLCIKKDDMILHSW